MFAVPWLSLSSGIFSVDKAIDAGCFRGGAFDSRWLAEQASGLGMLHLARPCTVFGQVMLTATSVVWQLLMGRVVGRQCICSCIAVLICC